MARAAKLDLRTFQQELASRLATKTAAQVESSRLGLSSGGERWLIRLADAGEVVTVPRDRAGAADAAVVPRRREHPRQPLQRRRLREVPGPRRRPRGGQTRLRAVRRARRRNERGDRRAARARACATSPNSRPRRRRRTRPRGTRSAGWTATATRGRKSTSRCSRGIPRSCRSGFKGDAPRPPVRDQENGDGAQIAGNCSAARRRSRPTSTSTCRRRRSRWAQAPASATTRSRRCRSWSSCARATASMTMPRKLPLHRPPARRQAVPDARHPDGHVPRVRGADGVPRQPPVGAGRGRRGDGDGNADAVAAARARQRARGAGPGDGVRRGQGQPRPLQDRPRRAAERRHRPRRERSTSRRTKRPSSS